MIGKVFALGERQGVRFVIAGLAQLAVDWLLFVALTGLGIPTGVANPVSRCLVVAMGFWLHSVYTFAESGVTKLNRERALRFFPAWIALTLSGTLVLVVVRHTLGLHATWIAKPVVDACLAVVSFVVLRSWVFR